MGSSAGIGQAGERPSHAVKISRPFYLQKTEVTQGQWREVMGDNPSRFNKCGDDCPVEMVSWEDAKKFIKKLNKMEGSDKYRLPTEAEWEYACRAGTSTNFSFGDDASKLGEYAWYIDNHKGGPEGYGTHPVGTRKPNPWGPYDMHGNVWEWCQDWYDGNYYNISPEENPQGPQTGSLRVTRGGSWNYNAQNCGSAVRQGNEPGFRGIFIGFRLASQVRFPWPLIPCTLGTAFRPEAQ